MEQFFAEIRAAVNNGLWTLGLFGVLAVPDICGALGSADGLATGAKYKAWFDQNLGAKYPKADATEFYKLRCSMLHQGASATATFGRTAFLGPGTVKMHNCTVNNDIVVLDMATLASDVIDAASAWLSANEQSEPVKSNLTKLMRWHPNGLPPLIQGQSVLS